MADRIVTLCDACKELYEIGGFRVKPVSTARTEKKKECENCGHSASELLKQYIVSSKRR